MTTTGTLGNRAEKLALDYLRKQGLSLLEKNYRSRFGEIDLIMRQNDYLVFVEVRYRKSGDYGGALASIDQRKQRKLRRTAETYLQRHKASDQACRFDILCLQGELDQAQIEWLENAF
ncbi:MAG: YraN family protein [Gammaproteobacteria bacterium]|nr:YraN family protein [Gammaproteobacteria bacterium]